MAHEKLVLKYAGNDILFTTRVNISVTINPIDDAERNSDGDLLIQPINIKDVIKITWGKLSGTQINNILSILRAKRFGTLEYYDINSGDIVSREVYWGAGVTIDYLRFDDDMEKQIYKAFSVNFIEI